MIGSGLTNRCLRKSESYGALVYPGRYLYRGLIREKDIIACENGKVTFRYQNSKTKQTECNAVTGEAFLWRPLQHTLPKGFRRARHFGCLRPNSKQLIQILQLICKLDRDNPASTNGRNSFYDYMTRILCN